MGAGAGASAAAPSEIVAHAGPAPSLRTEQFSIAFAPVSARKPKFTGSVMARPASIGPGCVQVNRAGLVLAQVHGEGGAERIFDDAASAPSALIVSST